VQTNYWTKCNELALEVPLYLYDASLCPQELLLSLMVVMVREWDQFT